MGKTGLQKYMDKAFSETPLPEIATPSGGGVRLSREGRVRLASGSVRGRGESSGRRGRPAGKKANQVPMNFLVDAEFRDSLVALKDRLHRGSVKDLFIEAMTDLLEKYSGVSAD